MQHALTAWLVSAQVAAIVAGAARLGFPTHSDAKHGRRSGLRPAQTRGMLLQHLTLSPDTAYYSSSVAPAVLMAVLGLVPLRCMTAADRSAMIPPVAERPLGASPECSPDNLHITPARNSSYGMTSARKAQPCHPQQHSLSAI